MIASVCGQSGEGRNAETAMYHLIKKIMRDDFTAMVIEFQLKRRIQKANVHLYTFFINLHGICTACLLLRIKFKPAKKRSK